MTVGAPLTLATAKLSATLVSMTLRAAFLASFLLFACDDEDARSPRPTEPDPTEPRAAEPRAAESSPEAAQTPAASHPASVTEAIPEAEIRARLDEWVAAQNEGDFARYSALYAERFEGVKRAEDRVYRFDHAGWLENRARMFQRPMTVAMSDVAIRLTPQSAVVNFTQRWSSATYSDEGPKRMVLVPSPAGLQIAREEMLASELPEHRFTADYLPILLLDGPYAVIAVSAEDSWGAGAPVAFAPTNGVFAAWRAATEAPEGRVMPARPVAVYAADGTRCEGTLGEHRLVRRVVPHFGAVQVWNGEQGDPPVSAEARAEAIWTMGADETFLAAKVEGCSGGLYAASRDAHPVFYQGTEDRDGDALLTFRDLPAWRALQTDFTDVFDGTGPWDAADLGNAPTERRRWTANGETLVTIEARGGVGCAEFWGRVSAVLEEVGGRFVLRSEGLPELDFLAVVDLDGDGEAEILVEDGMLRLDGHRYERVVDLSPPFLDCGC